MDEMLASLLGLDTTIPDWIQPVELNLPDWLLPVKAGLPDWLLPVKAELPDWLLPVKAELPDWLLPVKAELPDWILPVKLPDWLTPSENPVIPEWCRPINIIQSYIDFGFKVIPLQPASKKPLIKAWNEAEAALKSSKGRGDYGVAIQHAFSNTCSLDIDDLELARPMLLEHGINVDSLLTDPSMVQVVSGIPNKAKFLFRMYKPMLSQIISIMRAGKNECVYELRSAVIGDKTQVDTIPPSIHPVTMQPYQWKGDWGNIPPIPQTLLIHWQNLIDTKETRRNIQVFRSHPTNEQEIMHALNFISPDCGRKMWIDVGMAIHNADMPFSIWDEWSKDSHKYDYHDTVLQWESFEHDGGITLGTLFAHAKEGGYVRPKPDVSELFHDTQLTVEYDELSNIIKHAPPDIDVSVFPNILKMRAEEISTQRGCDVVIPLMAGLSAMSSALDARSRLYVGEDYAVPPILWCMTIGAPGDKKTPGSTPMFDIVKTIEKEQLSTHKKDLVIHEALENAYNASKKKYIEFLGSEESLLGNETPPELLDEPIKPSPLRLILSDVTSQKMCQILGNQPRGLTAVYDELGSFVRKMNDPRSGDDRGAWIQAYEGGSYSLDRVGSGYTIAENFAATIYGNLQPKVLSSEIPKMANDGLLQRFIPGIIRADKTTITQKVPKSEFRKEYESAIRNAFAVGKKNYFLDHDAQQEFRKFQVWFEKRRQDNRVLHVDDVYMTAFSKLESTLARIALIFHAYDAPHDEMVKAGTMVAAINFVRFYIVPALKFCYQSAMDGIEQWIIDYVTSVVGIQDTVTLSDIKRSGSNTFRDMNSNEANVKINDALGTLEQMEWVVNILDTRTSKTWAINPALVESCKDNRKKILLARQRIMDDTTASIRASAGKESIPRQIVKGYSVEWDSEL